MASMDYNSTRVMRFKLNKLEPTTPHLLDAVGHKTAQA